MRTNPKNPAIKPKKETQGSNNSILRMLFGFIWGQKKWLAWLAVILFVFGVLDRCGDSPTKTDAERPHLFVALAVGETVVGEGQNISIDQSSLDQAKSEKSIFGGTVLGAIIAPSAQSSINSTGGYDNSDEINSFDLSTRLDDSVVGYTNPLGTPDFSGYKKDVTTYVVRQGDNPEKIAIQFDINTDTLLSANGLTENSIIKPGQTLTILPINGVRVKVGAKDTLASIAKKYNGDQMEIIAFNNLDLNGSLSTGDYIIIPDGELPPPPKAKPRYTVPTNKFVQTPIPAGWLIWPVAGGIITQGLHYNNAVDIANHCGTPVYAAAAGTVIVARLTGYNGGYGKFIEIQHDNGVVTLYGHSSQLLVDVGQYVAQGQMIMLMGTTGHSTGCHTHFEVHGAVNPFASWRKGSGGGD